MTTEIQWDLYPDTISCEQLRLILHISKRRASWLLQQQIIKCQIIDTNATWKYVITKKDLQLFVHQVQNGELIPPARPSPKNKNAVLLPSLNTVEFRKWLEDEWFDIPDLLYNNEIYHVEAVVGHTYGAGNVIPTGVIGTIKVNRYICVNFFPAIILLTF